MNGSPKTSSIEQDQEVAFVSQSGEIIMNKKQEPITKIEQDCYMWRGKNICPQKETQAVAKPTINVPTLPPDAVAVNPKKDIGGVDPFLVIFILFTLIPFKLIFIGWLVLRVTTKITNKL
jgi:hypothetical protein